MMICENKYPLLAICLYLKGYLTDSDFEQLVIDYHDRFEKELSADIFLELISADLDSKADKISLCTQLHRCAEENFREILDGVNDTYVEKLTASDAQDGMEKDIVRILTRQPARAEISTIDCGSVTSKNELISALKLSLGYPGHCGNNWAAVRDFIGAAAAPEKLVVVNMEVLEERMPDEARIFREVLSLMDGKTCAVEYAARTCGQM